MSLDLVLARIQQLQPPAQPVAAPATEAPAQTDSTSFATQLDAAMQPSTTTTAPAPAAAAAPVTTPQPAAAPSLHGPGCCCCCCGLPTAVPATTTTSAAGALTQPVAVSAAVPAAETAAPDAVPATVPGGAATPYDAQIQAAAARYGVDPDLVKAVIQQESGFDPSATSGVGAQGLMQLMPDTAAGLGVDDAYDPEQSIDGGTRYLGDQLARFGGDESLAVAAYNAGPGAVAQYGGIPPYAETQNYVKSVLANLAAFKNTTP